MDSQVELYILFQELIHDYSSLIFIILRAAFQEFTVTLSFFNSGQYKYIFCAIVVVLKRKY